MNENVPEPAPVTMAVLPLTEKAMLNMIFDKIQKENG